MYKCGKNLGARNFSSLPLSSFCPTLSIICSLPLEQTILTPPPFRDKPQDCPYSKNHGERVICQAAIDNVCIYVVVLDLECIALYLYTYLFYTYLEEYSVLCSTLYHYGLFTLTKLTPLSSGTF